MRDIIEKFPTKKILVVGDFMIDRYEIGDANRVCPEAPVTEHEYKRTEDVPGGAGNTARNLALLGAKVYVAGVAGADNDGVVLHHLIEDMQILPYGIITDYNRITTVKQRFVAENFDYWFMFRHSKERRTDVSGVASKALIGTIRNSGSQVDAIVVSEYAKGVFTQEIAETVREAGLGKIVIADIKPPHKEYVRGYNVLKPNMKEAREMADNFATSPEALAVDIGQKLDISVAITDGKKGIIAYDKCEARRVATKGKEAFDVTGAGDTVAAVLALSLASGADLFKAASIANAAAGIVVQRRRKWEPIISLKELLEAV